MIDRYTCRDCGGAAHPASGAEYAPGFVVCGPCVRRFWAWARVHVAHSKRVGKRPSKVFVSFYEAAGRWAA